MQYIEILYILTAYAMNGLLLYLNPKKDGHVTASEIAASHRLTRLTFLWGLIIAGIFFAILMQTWLIPHFKLDYIFSIFVILLLVFQILTGLVPAQGNKQMVIHTIGAYGLGLCMFFLVSFFSITPTIHNAVRSIDTILAILLGSLILTSKFFPAKSYLVGEQIFFG